MNVGLLGCGNVSVQYVKGLGHFRGVQLVAVADVDLPRAEALAEGHDIAALGPDELLASADVEIVVNLTPALAHVEASSAVLAAGKHAYSEKPLAVDLAGGPGLMERAPEARLRLP